MSNDGWKPPQTDQDVRQQFFDKYGDDEAMRRIDRKWRTLGRLIESRAKIHDGRLGQ